ncbi:MAG: Chromosome-partitioning protein Spo0J (plasmid) [Chroococcopsis gigantea SAG 12.99]|jgi:ParB family chromosome partitioning protein|nr:Chromosome-partitioning protein Spo0J [Chroococcopsis gigantea SAG 12.99]
MSPRKTEKPFNSQITAPWIEPIQPIEKAEPSKIALKDIHLPPQQPRRYFDPRAMEELSASVRQHGILQPLLVRPLATGGYELVAGERRYRAATESALKEVPAVVRELSNEEALQFALIENLQREDLNPIEETEGILQLLSVRLAITVDEVISQLYRLNNEATGLVNHNVMVNPDDETNHNVMVNSQESLIIQEVFESLGRMGWESFVKNRLPLLKLPAPILSALRDGKLAYTKALALARVKDEALRDRLLSEALAENLSLLEIKERIKSRPSQSMSGKTPDSLSVRLKTAYQQLKKSKVWETPDKRTQLEGLLAQLEALVEDDETVQGGLELN